MGWREGWGWGGGDESLFAASGSHDQDGHHAFIQIFPRTKGPMALGLGSITGDNGPIKFKKFTTLR